VVLKVPPSGGSLEIGNPGLGWPVVMDWPSVPPSGGSLEIGNPKNLFLSVTHIYVPPSGGSLEIGNNLQGRE